MPGVIADPLDILEAQIVELEKKIIGNFQLSDKETPIAESLVSSSQSLQHLVVSNYDSIAAVFDRISELGTYLDPVYEDSIADTVMKAKLVLESEPDIRTMLNQLNALNTMNESLSPEPYKEIPNLTEKLRKHSEQIIKGTAEFEEVEMRTRKLSEDFYTAMITFDRANNLIASLLSEIEEAGKIKKIDTDIE